MNKQSQILLEANNLWKIFGSVPGSFNPEDPLSVQEAESTGAVVAVRDVSFQVKQGEVFVILGLSGSGKSTLIRCIPRLINPTRGEINVNGRDVVQMNEHELTMFRRTEVAMVFQHYGLLPHRNVLENVGFGLKLQGIDIKERNERARKAINQVGLEGWEHHYPAQLSGGMCQRVGIARALVQDSDILLMDEPFSGLDPLIRREMQDQLIRLQEDLNKTIIFVTHDLNEAIRLGDRMVVMREGIFVQEGTPQEIMNNPVDEYVERFVAGEQELHAMKQEQHPKYKIRLRSKQYSTGASNTAPLVAARRR